MYQGPNAQPLDKFYMPQLHLFLPLSVFGVGWRKNKI